MRRPQNVTQPCLGCDEPIEYRIVLEPGAAPEVYPIRTVHAFQGGHLCSDCGDAAAAMLRGRKAARDPMAQAAIKLAAFHVIGDESIEVSEGREALVSPTAAGYHVQAWVWVAKP